MSSAKLYRLSGFSLLMGSILAIGGGFLGMVSSDPASTIAIAGALIAFIGGTFGLLGLPGMYVRQAQRAGALGLIGTVLMIGYTLILGTFGSALDALVLPFIATHAPSLTHTSPAGLDLFFLLGGVLGVVGGLCLGIATIRAAILPRWAGMLIMIGVVLQFVGDFLQLPLANLGFLLVMIGFAWLGGALWSKRQYIETLPEFSTRSASGLPSVG